MKRAHGFTLIEVLLALVLLAAGLALAFATLRSATAMVERGELRAQRNERTRAVEGFLRMHVGAALPVVFETDPSNLRQARFLGTPDRMRFVADLPAYLGRGGPYLYDISADDQGRLIARFSMVQSGNVVSEPRAIKPELLADNLRVVRFRYRGINAEGKLGEWQPGWQTGEILPLQIAMEVQGEDGARWPDLIVTLIHSEGGAGGGERKDLL